MLGYYILVNYAKTFFLLFFVIVGLLYVYLLGELLLLYKRKSAEVFLSYALNFLPVAFFYGGAFVAGLALVALLRSLTQRKIDLLAQSFGISPLKLSSYFLLFSLLLSLVNLYGSYRLYGESQKRLHKIEREHKKVKTDSGLVKNLWLKQQLGSQTLFYNFELVEMSTGRIHGFFLLRVEGGSIGELITAREGLWQDRLIRLKGATLQDLTSGEERTQDLTLEYLSLERIEPLAEKPEHLSLKEAFTLSLLGERFGVKHRHYAYEIFKRATTSVLPALLTLVLSWTYLRWRRANVALLMLVSLFSLHWFLLNLVRSFVEDTDMPLWLAFLFYLPLPAVSSVGLYDLAKGFRI
ncbi:MAG: LptF/LptG family permease [Aquificaceae bacterium]|nr:LptF/LptG family permease [Aquificaceae bacterium]MDW8097122.1 LptF/LptG family permease [Aquificaceae bacterium]